MLAHQCSNLTESFQGCVTSLCFLTCVLCLLQEVKCRHSPGKLLHVDSVSYDGFMHIPCNAYQSLSIHYLGYKQVLYTSILLHVSISYNYKTAQGLGNVTRIA